MAVIRAFPVAALFVPGLLACQTNDMPDNEVLPTPYPEFFAFSGAGLQGFELVRTEEGVQHVIYESPVRGFVTAYIIDTGTGGPLPAAIYLHPSGSGRTSQIDEARQLAAQGYVVMLIDSPKVRPDAWRISEDHAIPNHNRDIYRQHIIDTRRGIDLLAEQSSVDASRISVIGKNIGGGFAGILSGVEGRVGTFVIQAAIPELGKFWPTMAHPTADAFRARVGQERLEEHALETAVTDALNYVDLRADKRVLYQWGEHDDWLTREQAQEMVDRTTGEVTSIWYDDGHGLTSPAVVGDYIRWLTQQE